IDTYCSRRPHSRAVSEDENDKSTLAQSTLRRGEAMVTARASLVLYHRDTATVTPLTEGVPVVLGRAWPADVVVADPALSRRHARCTGLPGGVQVEDLQSTNGTYLRGERIESALLPPGEIVMLGSL